MNGNPTAAPPTVGTLASARVSWSASGMPSLGEFEVKFTFNGGTITEGPIFSNVGNSFYQGTTKIENWLVKPGALKAELIPLNGLVDTAPADNVATLGPAVTFQSGFNGETKFVQPIPGTPLVNWYINNYVDLNTKDGVLIDYNGGGQTYDGHDALDIGVGEWDAMDLGVPILAVASGVVINRDDGNFDRETKGLDAPNTPNFVAIDHGNGWVTSYLHMRKNSVAVQVGDVVKAGEVIGLVGSSGMSTGPHLHLAVFHMGRVVETYASPSGYWFSPSPYTNFSPDVFPASSSTYFITENGGAVNIFAGPFAHLTTSNGTAKSGSDYTAVNADVGFIAPVPILNDSKHEPQEQFKAKVEIDLLNQSWNATVKIVDNDHLLNYDADTDVLTVNGSVNGNDIITIDVAGSNLRVIVNGEVSLFPLNSPNWPLSSVFVSSGDGQDTITILETAANLPIDINSGSGNDTIHVHTTAPGGSVFIDGSSDHDTFNVGNPDELFDMYFSLGGLKANVTVHGNIGKDTLNVKDNYLVGSGYGYTITDKSVQRAGLGKVSYIAAESVALSTGGAGDTVAVVSTGPDTPVTVNTDGGNDTVTVGKPTFIGSVLSSIESKVTVNTGGGTGDALLLQDFGSFTDNTYGISDTTVTRSGAGSVAYSGVEELTLNAGSGDDEFFISRTVADTTVNAGLGDDTIRVGRIVGFNIHTLDSILGDLTIQAGGGTNDSLLLRDSGEASGHTYWVNATTVQRSGAALITYGGVEELEVIAGNFDDTFAVFGTAAITATTLDGRDGGDAFTVGTFNKLAHIPLDGVLGPLAIDGGAGSGDSLILNDQAGATGKEYLLTANFFKWDGGTTIIYTSLNSLTLNATDHDDKITVEGTGATTLINANGGTDAIAVTPASKNLEFANGLTVDAGGGADSMTLNDQNNPYDAGALSHVYTVTGGLVGRWFMAGQFGPFFLSLGYDAVETLNLFAGSQGDFIQVQGTSAGTRVIGGGGDDTVAVGNAANTLDGLLGLLVVNGGDHIAGDKLFVNDQGTATAKTYTVDGTSVSRTGAAKISFGTMEALTLNAGNGSDTINVNGTAATTPVLINAGGGNDHIEVNTPIGLDGLQGALAVDGQGHLPNTLGDGLELRDDPNAAGRTYTVEVAGITRDGIAPITYVGIEHLGVSAGTGNDVFNVRGTLPSPFFMGVNGNKGDDVFNVGSLSNTLDTVGPLIVHDIGGGYDHLFLNDQGNSSATNYFISENEVNRVSPYLVVQYGPTEPLERVVFNGSSGGNQVTVHSLKPGTAFEVNSGAGDDSIAMLPGAAIGSLTLDGQGGINTLDYSAYATDVVVNLTLGTATNVVGGIANVANVTGGTGHDILVGAAGKNVLAGGGGRDLLIGGVGGDWLDGGADDDLLFDGTTAYDSDPATLLAIRSVWVDPAMSYEDRVDNLRSSYLSGGVVTSDGEADQLLGQGGRDWFWANLAFDLLPDRDPLTEELG